MPTATDNSQQIKQPVPAVLKYRPDSELGCRCLLYQTRNHLAFWSLSNHASCGSSRAVPKLLVTSDYREVLGPGHRSWSCRLLRSDSGKELGSALMDSHTRAPKNPRRLLASSVAMENALLRICRILEALPWDPESRQAEVSMFAVPGLQP